MIAGKMPNNNKIPTPPIRREVLRKNAIMYFNEDGFELEFNVKKTKEAYYGHIESINRFVAKMREKINILDAISLSH